MMTSIAAFISILAGGSPQDSEATPANAAGTGGAFSALLAATGAPPVTEGEIAANPIPIDPAAASQAGQAIIDVKTGDAGLRQALTEGLELPQGGAEIDAAIIDSPESADATATVTLAPAGTQKSEGLTPNIAAETPAQNIAILQSTLERSDAPAPAPAAARAPAPAPAPERNTAAPAPDAQPSTIVQPAPDGRQAPITHPAPTVQPIPVPPPVETAPVLLEAKPADISRGEATPGRVDPAQPGRVDADGRRTGLENALNRASETGIKNGLENAVIRSARPNANAKAQPQGAGLAQADGRANAKAAPAARTGTGENSLTVKPSEPRPEFAPRGPAIIQQPIKPGSGQTLIRFQSPTGTDLAGASSPPTLTVSVPAQVAPPSPAPANVPHVPVSALAVHIAQQASNGARRFDIRLDPPELGRIEVRLEVSRDGQVMTHLVVERSETLDLLQRDARQLERALQDAGLNTSKEDMKFSLKDQDLAQGGNGQEDPEEDSGSVTGERDENPTLIPNDAMPPPTQYIASAGLDIRI